MQLSAIAKWSLSAVLVSVATMAVADAQISMGASSGGGGGSGTVNTGTTNALGYYAAPGTTISPITACANGVYSTNGLSVPGCGTTLPTALIIPGASSISAGSSAPALTAGTGGPIALSEGTAPSVGPASGVDILYANSTNHCVSGNYNNGGYGCIPISPTSVVSGHLVTWSGTLGSALSDGGAVPNAGCAAIGSPTANALLIDNGSGCPSDSPASYTSSGLNIPSTTAYLYNNVKVVQAQTSLGNLYYGGGNLTGTGSNNLAVGGGALGADTGGGSNTAVGINALASTTSGLTNTAVGTSVLYANTSGARNVAIGFQAGYTATGANANVSGNDNTYIGYNCGASTASQLSNSFCVGSGALFGSSNTGVLGNASVTDVYFGSATGAAKFHGLVEQLTSSYNGSGGSAIPTCASGLVGQRAFVTDATIATLVGAWGTTYSSGGTYTVAIECIFNSTGSVYTWVID